MLELFARAYTTVSVDDVAACIGLPPDQAVQSALIWPLGLCSAADCNYYCFFLALCAFALEERRVDSACTFMRIFLIPRMPRF
jgi:hypothetical protein